MTSKNLTGTLMSGLLALLCTLPAAAANLAGSAVFVSGKVTATDPAGGIRELQARDEVYSGDLLETRKGRVQIKFADGAFMSIQPNSRFLIEEYHYANKSDGSEKAIYNLLKGGMRAFTGAIGKAHPDAYKVKTPVATIGIRGTGHNTRFCQGDCWGLNGQLLLDGLHHTTWEGITFVENDLHIKVVPTRMSIYVQSIDSPIQETNEASVVTAVQPSQITIEELAAEQEEQVTLEAGDQRNSSGNPGALPPPPPPDMGMVQNQTLLAIETDLFRNYMDPGNAEGGLVGNTTVLVGPDSMDMVGMFAAAGTVVDEDNSGMGVDETLDVLVTIDPNGVLAVGMPDANITRAQEFINDALLDVDDSLLVDSVITDPATVAEHTEGTFQGTDFAFGRWNDGKILFIDEVTSGPNTGQRIVEVDDLGLDNYFHYLYGDTADTNFGVGATGTYTLLPERGTSSTDTHDGFVGTGVVSGSLTFDFTSLNGKIVDMIVLHDTSYTVNGDLFIDPAFPVGFSETISGIPVEAVTTGGLCDEGCETLIDGTFFGSLAGTGVNGAPRVAGLDYEIITEPYDGEIGNSIIGNAVFGRSGTAAPIPDVFTVTPNQNLVAVLPNPTQPPPVPDEFADVGVLLDMTSIVGNDSTSRNGLLLAAGSEIDENTLDTFFVVATIDPNGMLGVTDPDPNVVAAQGLINDALVSNNALVQSVNNNPAAVAEFFQGAGFAYGRWADGNILFLDENLTGGGAKTVEVDTLAGYQSMHFIYGDTPATSASGATGTYDFIGGTQSTTVSGATIGLGVTSGQLTFDFDALSGTVAMTVNHLTDYNVAGTLAIDNAIQGQFFDTGAVATTVGGNCDNGCATFIDGGFAGALAGGAQASPGVAGLEYDIFDPIDGIMGVAAFGRTGDGPSLLP